MVKRKASVLEAEKEEGSIVGNLQEELQEYKEMLKCRVCHDRPKEVIILIIISCPMFGRLIHFCLAWNILYMNLIYE